jgi:SAM-dependent methyltransferase
MAETYARRLEEPASLSETSVHEVEPMTNLPKNYGTGPGPITADGCAVDYYATLTPNGEPERIHGAIPPGASILELGAGTGRITHRLVELDHEVVAVDQSPEMLAHIVGVETVCSSIETLQLGRRFDLVLLMSFVIETADDQQRGAFLATCRRHVSDGGSVVLQRHPPEWYDAIEPIERRLDARSPGCHDRVHDRGPPLDPLLHQQAARRRAARSGSREGRPGAGRVYRRRSGMGPGDPTSAVSSTLRRTDQHDRPIVARQGLPTPVSYQS